MMRRFVTCCAALMCVASAPAGGPDFTPAPDLVALDKAVDWSKAKLIAVQHGNRYKTLEAFARESMSSMTGAEQLPGVSPMASLMEWVFNKDAYADQPLIYIKAQGLRVHFSTQFPPDARRRIVRTGYMSLREFEDPETQKRLSELSPRTVMGTAIRRVNAAQVIAENAGRVMAIVPAPGGDKSAPWYSPFRLIANMPLEAMGGLTAEQARAEFGAPVPNVPPEVAITIVGPLSRLGLAWRGRDAAGVTASLNDLAERVEAFAAGGYYPSQRQRIVEARYYESGKFVWGWVFYFVGLLAAIWALATGWRAPWVISLAFAAVALGFHGLGIAQRWSVLGRIPVANMFEALIFSAAVGIFVVAVCELYYRSRVFLVAAQAAGFMALIFAGYVLPGGGTISSILEILDDIMLRIHTTLIISSYAMIFIAGVIGLIYLFGYYVTRHVAKSLEVGLMAGFTGAAVLIVSHFAFIESDAILAGPDGFIAQPGVTLMFGILTFVSASAASFLAIRGSYALVPSAALLFVAALTMSIGYRGFAVGMGWTMVGGGMAWATANLIAMFRRPRPAVIASGLSGGVATVALGGPA
ncbi:MAG: hypothetical protein KDA32_09355, partial [Phycisphaerales bacterium]|nr:hypothetical protein [Phycisphaerales bacterium]